MFIKYFNSNSNNKSFCHSNRSVENSIRRVTQYFIGKIIIIDKSHNNNVLTQNEKSCFINNQFSIQEFKEKNGFKICKLFFTIS